ncbi:CPBP family intramembrane glutamic endopeptidase [Aestuariibaculum marinum]|uniref:CPBP family intramembrane metalloprotease n=1 Tax=Aestuariibaculum marinum TaxID=2683592 RepID=A0A8J6Q8C6_9FLAO|nr:CPBP family intramembrane glutamic endopeptidase [Aestuariibaculum marinum]MBD0825273.1 CPBP family intramembrane metalloprotease [Aestuariibaculum marinum]
MNFQLTIWVLGVSFTAYFLISIVFNRLGINNLQSSLNIINGLKLLNLKHVLGILLFGVLPFAVFPEMRQLVYSVGVFNLHVLVGFLLACFLCVFTACLAVGNNHKLNDIDAVSFYQLSNARGYFAIRFVFLLCYEFFFRGIVFFFFLESYGLTLSILYVTFFYVLIHAFDSKREMLGAIPFGVLLCVFSYYTGSIWYAFLLHMALSAVYEISIFYHLTFKNQSTS